MSPVVHRSPIDDVAIPDTSVTAHVLRRAAELADKPAIIDGPSGRVMTFAELDRQIHALAGGLIARGLRPGDTLALAAPNMPEFAVVFHATAVAGATVTTINPTYNAEEMAFQLRDAGATLLVTVPAFVEITNKAVVGTAVRETIVMNVGDEAAPEGTTALRDVFSTPATQVPIVPAETVMVLPYSSGTTGLPKGVMLTHRNLVANIVQIDALLAYEDRHAGFAALPFFHIYGMQVLMNGLLSNGCTVVTVPRFDLAQALQLIQEHRLTHFYAVPPMILALAKQPMVADYDLSSLELVLSGAAPLGAELAEEASARIGCQVAQAYGMTELSPVTHLTPPGQYRAGSVGLTVANAECRIVDTDTDEDLGIDEVGELWMRGPMVMTGYLNNPGATAETIDAEGWLRTGDIARIDADGHTYIVDRAKELIKVKGFQVAPAELEALLITHPGVADVAVVGIDDGQASEVPKAFVVAKPDYDLTETELCEFVAERVATYKRIGAVEFLDEIPKSASGKILRRYLRDRA